MSEQHLRLVDLEQAAATLARQIRTEPVSESSETDIQDGAVPPSAKSSEDDPLAAALAQVEGAILGGRLYEVQRQVLLSALQAPTITAAVNRERAAMRHARHLRACLGQMVACATEDRMEFRLAGWLEALMPSPARPVSAVRNSPASRSPAAAPAELLPWVKLVLIALAFFPLPPSKRLADQRLHLRHERRRRPVDRAGIKAQQIL